MKTYMVTYEVREVGAIGVFEPHTDAFEANSEDDAKEAFRKAHKFLELRACLGVVAPSED